MISFREKDYMYSYNKMKPTAFSTHLHKYYEFLYFAHGDATYVVEGNEYKAEDGDLFITCPGELHSIVFKSDRDYERHFIQISEEFLAGEQCDMLKLLRDKPVGKNNKISHRLLTEEAERCFLGVQRHVVNGGEEGKLLAKTYIIQLLNLVNGLLYNTFEAADGENERIRAAKEYIGANITQRLTLDSLAEAIYTDKFYLSHLFKKECGMNITDYISMQRVALAKKLIIGGRSATEVFSECGFNDYSSFYRAFKKLSGKSPTEFFKDKR